MITAAVYSTPTVPLISNGNSIYFFNLSSKIDEKTTRQLATFAPPPAAHCGPSVSHSNPIAPLVGMSVSELYAKAPLQTGMMSLSHFNPSILPRTSPF